MKTLLRTWCILLALLAALGMTLLVAGMVRHAKQLPPPTGVPTHTAAPLLLPTAIHHGEATHV